MRGVPESPELPKEKVSQRNPVLKQTTKRQGLMYPRMVSTMQLSFGGGEDTTAPRYGLRRFIANMTGSIRRGT